jgi:hypothetical protein
MWSKSDKLIIRQLEGAGEPYCVVRFFCIFRKGSLLLALPKDKPLALVTLSLYQPQSLKARLLVTVISLLIKCNLHTRLLTSCKLPFCKEGPIYRLNANNSGFGFLLGNSDSEARSLILARKTGNEFYVDKIGLSAAAKEAISDEVSIMCSLPKDLVGLVELSQSSKGDSWSYYSCPLVVGRSPAKQQDDLVLSLLEAWLDLAHMEPLVEAVQWLNIVEYIEARELQKGYSLIDGCADIEIMVGVYHGDFAPWNIKISEGEEVVAMDWEYGTANAPAAWDWMHYLIQRAYLVENLSCAETLKACRDWATTEKGKAFMQAAGWGDKIELCIGSYLIYSCALDRFAHDELLSEWLNNEVKI